MTFPRPFVPRARLLLGLLACTLAGCGGSNPEVVATPAAPATPETAAPAPGAAVQAVIRCAP